MPGPTSRPPSSEDPAGVWAEAILAAEGPILAMIGVGRPRVEVLDALCRMVERLSDGSICVVLLPDPDDGHLGLAAAPSLPESWRDGLRDFPVAPTAQPDGPPVAEDVADDPGWAGSRDRALASGLRARWSSPIRSESGDDSGRVVALRRAAGRPTAAESRLLGRAAALAGIAVDRDRCERASAEGRLYRRIVETANEGIWVLDADQRTTYVNASMARMLGLPHSEIIGRSAWDFVFDDDRAEGGRHWEERSRGEPGRAEFRLRRADGSAFWTQGSTSPVLDDDGRFVGALGMFADVTDRKRLEEALHHRVEELALTDRRKDEFLALLAHELRNPLAPIRHSLHLLRRTVDAAPDLEPILATAERQAVHISRIVDDLLDVSRISQGKIGLRVRRVELAPIVRRAVDAILPALSARGHHLILDLPPGPILLEADPTRIEQVLDNLLSNAAKYTDPGGTVVLSVEVEPGEALIRVRDTGIGISPAMLSRVFDLFVQAERRTDRSQGGLGIGLSLARSLAELHGGTIEARSDGPGRGSEFLVRLPRMAESHRESAAPSSLNPGGPPRRRVLVVDDNDDAANMLARLLTRLYGQDVRVAYDGPTALEAAEAFTPQVVLLDLGMPGMDGCEVARRLRQIPATRNALIAAVTGWSQDRDRLRSTEAGFDRHLVKPVEPDDLRDLLSVPAVSA